MSALADRLQEIKAAPSGKQVCAFFDYDGTLLDGFSAVAILRARLRSLEFTGAELLDGLMVALRGCSSEQDYAEVLEATRPAFAGKTYAELLAMGEKLFKEDTASKLRPQMWQVIRAHRAKGHRIVIASSATRFQIEPIAKQIDADHALATDVEVIDGVVTGRILGRPLWGPGKAAAVRRLAAEHDLDLASSFAYSDGNEDVPYLESVGHPAAISPQSGLRAVAEARGWPILELRNPSHSALSMIARTSAFYGSFLGGAAVGIAKGLMGGEDSTAAMQDAVASGIDTGFALAGVSVDVLDGREHLEKARPCVFVFNHQSKLDLPVMIHLVRDHATGVAKKEIRSVPLFGQILQIGGVAFIDRADAGKAIEQLEPVVQKIQEEGLSLVVAPEGTRSATPRIGPFKKGPFHIAMQAGVPIVPVVMRNAGELMWRGAQLIKPGTVEVRVLPPVDTSDWVPEKAGEYAEQVREQFLDALADWPVTAFDDGRMTRTMGVFEWKESAGD
ncbi:putative phosphoserine phosphatase / 1-acylglycerol-3-phosphate O-acyltransferase [Gordonia malaquae]|uniref:1-acyl-sn-glycerol-3-phosphate acyltransferase n=1 Tax=Gordonia malaquae NBRC 108250 TaxID=1223542 RepID=M3VBD7_GORML|nr:HAD-IB family hydrolase [Gordonia malaquae]GAC80083.1 1-acylglycerol-3-phosphate O-acyltransferase [Gordonia malaquae NBRC 108250]SEC36635.1 putative phosphoserine phosphatase / 1-acylglycerol-3-phosphate O-acyltransferase [Gordonia malaquae]